MSAASVRAAARAVLVAAAIGFGSGPALVAQTEPAPAPVNTLCPVLTDEEVLPEHTLEWQGRTIGLCCAKCVRKFREHPELYVENLPALAAPAPDASGASDTAPTDISDGAAAQTAAPAGTTAGATAAAPADAPGGLAKLVGRVHPLLVHFPIALLLAAALAEMMGALRGRSGSAPTARYCLALGALGAVAAAISGWQRAEGFAPLPGTESHVDIHRWLAVATAGSALLLTLVGLWSRERSTGERAPGLGLFRWGLLIAAALVGVTAHFGGTLVYGAGFPFSD